MSLSKAHQELLDKLYPKGYEIKSVTLQDGTVIDEHKFFHILFVKVIPRPKQPENELHVMVQKFGTKDWAQTKASIEKRGIGITGYNQYGVVHDPVQWTKAEVMRKAKAEAAEKAAAKKAEAEKPEVKPEPKAKAGPKPKAQK